VETVGTTSWACGLKPQFSSPARSIDCINQGLCHGFAIARIELGKPIDLELAFCLTLIALFVRGRLQFAENGTIIVLEPSCS
jgi:hypothetical protein